MRSIAAAASSVDAGNASSARKAASNAASDGVGGGKALVAGVFFAVLGLPGVTEGLDIFEVERDLFVPLLQRRIV